MSVTVTFSCGGCFKEVKGLRPLRRNFHSFSGKGYGFGVYRDEKPQDVAPEGWIAYDPYTLACYCPDCWAEIEEPEEKRPRLEVV
jgi:hypothetical protein